MKEFSGRVVDDVRELRNALATFATGVTVVTTRDDGGSPQGFTANSFTSVSLNPPLILVCIARSANCFPIFSSCKQFAVNILHEEQRVVSEIFATGTGDRFSTIDWQWSALQNPLLRGVVSWLDCRAVQSI
ncbi:MAG: flavin reductase family protein, partial [Pseudomonadota bacterium]